MVDVIRKNLTESDLLEHLCYLNKVGNYVSIFGESRICWHYFDMTAGEKEEPGQRYPADDEIRYYTMNLPDDEMIRSRNSCKVIPEISTDLLEKLKLIAGNWRDAANEYDDDQTYLINAILAKLEKDLDTLFEARSVMLDSDDRFIRGEAAGLLQAIDLIGAAITKIRKELC